MGVVVVVLTQIIIQLHAITNDGMKADLPTARLSFIVHPSMSSSTTSNMPDNSLRTFSDFASAASASGSLPATPIHGRRLRQKAKKIKEKVCKNNSGHSPEWHYVGAGI